MTMTNTEPLPQNPTLSHRQDWHLRRRCGWLCGCGRADHLHLRGHQHRQRDAAQCHCDRPAGWPLCITCDGTTIPVGGFITCTATYAVTQADIDAGSVYNLATADSDESLDRMTTTIPSRCRRTRRSASTRLAPSMQVRTALRMSAN